MKVMIWSHTRKPKTIDGEMGQELGIALTGSQRVGHGTLSKNDNANMDAIKQNGGHIIEKMDMSMSRSIISKNLKRI